MGNKLLRPDEFQPTAPFNDYQKQYIKQKFEHMCGQNNLLSPQAISDALKTEIPQAQKILNYIDFQGKGEVDYYQFLCAAATLHQDDQEAQQFIFDIYKTGSEMNQDSFKTFFKTVFRYLKFLDKIKDDYVDENGQRKFKQYDYNKNGSISIDEFRSMLLNDYHCRLWMETLGFAKQRPEQPLIRPTNQEIIDDQFGVSQQTGDQAGSTPSWIKTAQYMTPDKKYPNRINPPNQTLDINYVYGYRSYDTRNNIGYNMNNQVVYHTAGCGVILNKLKNTMKVTTQHNDDITCLDVNPIKNIVATGQMGRKPCLVIWDGQTCQTKAVFKNHLQKSISNVCISKSGKFVAATSMSDNHEIAVYNIQTKALVGFGRGPRSVVYAIKFNEKEDQIILACSKQVVFATFQNTKVNCKKGVFGKVPAKSSLSIALLGDSVITAMSDGLLVMWRGTSASKVYKQHTKPVGALCERSQGGIVSADSTGKIVIWSSGMVKQAELSLQKLLGNVKSNNIRIISLYEQHKNILVGTRGGQLIQISKGSASILMQGHYDEELWGLSTSNNKQQFFSGGQDKLLLKWDMSKRKLTSKKRTQAPISTLDISKQNILAVGLKNGTVQFYDASTFKFIQKITQHKNPDKDMISAVKFSPDGSKFAVAYCPPFSKIYIYDYKNGMSGSKPKVCKGSPSRISSIDFSQSGQQIMCNNTSYEILLYDTNSGNLIGRPTKLKNQQWATITSRFSWPTQGIWAPCSDGSDINSVDRSNSKKYIATADDFSKIKIFDYPVSQAKQIHNAFKGHSSHVTGVKWSFDDKYLISTGGLQKSIIQWENKEGQDIKMIIQQSQDQKQVQENEVQQQGEYQFQAQEDPSQKNKKQKKPKDQDDEFQVQSDQGDQALAVKPFEGQVIASTPAQYKTTGSLKNIAPEVEVQIKHAWGMRNQYINDRVRNQVKYSSDYKRCLFITAALGVDMNIQSKEQTFYRGHEEDLICFAITKDRKYCATGQMAQAITKSAKKKVDVHIWDTQSKKQMAKLSDFHLRAVVIVQFSPSGQKVLTVGQDDKNSLAVYDWKINRKAWDSPTGGAKLTGAAWLNQSQYATVGLKQVMFWNKSKGVMGKISGSSKWDPMLAIVCWNDKFISGGQSGNVYLWNGGNGTASKGHEGRVDCLTIDSKNNLYSGCSKGIIIAWKVSGGKLVQDRKVLDVSKIDKIDSGILSLDFNNDKMLIGTNSSSIFQVYLTKQQSHQVILNSHCKGQLWAASWSPDGVNFVTGGDDKTIRIFDSTTYQQKYLLSEKNIDKVRGVDWQQTQGQLIVFADFKGRVYLTDKKFSFVQKKQTRFSKTKPKQQPYWVQDIKFSPNGQFVAFGAHGGPSHIQIYQIKDKKFENQRIIKNIFSSALLSLDWSQDSGNIAAVSQAYQLQFTDLDKKIGASSTRQIKWATWSSKFGYCVKEIHQDSDYSNINAVCVNPTKSLVATGGDDQKIRLFNYPAMIPKQKNKELIGHSSHVTRVRFSNDQSYLLSEGGNDRTVILWQFQGQKAKKQLIQEKSQNQQNQQEGQVQDYEGVQDFQDIRVPKLKETAKIQIKQKQQTDDFQVQEDEGDQFMAVKPWKGAIKQPTNKDYYKGIGKAPPVNLQIDYAHGYRVKDCRNNLKYISDKQITYHTAGLGIIMEIQQNPKKQRFFNQHRDDVISFFKTKDNKIFTSQMGAKPTIYQWNQKCEKIKQYKGAKKGVSALAANQKYVVGACLDDNHQLFLYDVQTAKLIKQQKGGRQVILEIIWISTNEFVTIGIKHYKKWDVLDGKSLKGSNGQFGKNCNILCSLAFDEDSKNIYAGASDGSLQIWKGTSCTKSLKLHSGPIHALCIAENRILTGSGDKTIKILNLSDLAQIVSIKCEQILMNSVNCSIRALDVYQNRILVGTLGSQIYQIDSNKVISNSDVDSSFKMRSKLMSGHYAPNHVTNEVWGLSVYDQKRYITCSDDGTVRLWDTITHEQDHHFSLLIDEKRKPIIISPKDKFLPDIAKGKCITVNEDKWIVVGCKDGSIKIFDDKFKPKLVQKVSKNQKANIVKQISMVKFSPDGSTLGVADHQGFIAIYQWNEGQIKLKHRKIKHTSTILHFDFSRDGNWIHSTCKSYELLFWNVTDGKQLTSGATMSRDQQWATWNITLGWPVEGIFSGTMDGSDINAVDRSNNSYFKNMKLLASGDDQGKVKIFEYPCLAKNSSSVVGKGHSSHVTNVRFTRQDAILLSTGGQDQTIIQWKVQEK